MFKVETTGFDELQTTLREAQEALSTIDGEITTLKFDPTDPASVDAAVAAMESAIDEKIGRHAGNPFVAPLVLKAKQAYAAAIRSKARFAGSVGEVQ